MRKQKFILKSKTVISALFTLFVAIIPYLQEGLENGMSFDRWLYIISVLLTTTGTIIGRYTAQGEIYTPHGIPGRNYISATNQISESQTGRSQTDRRGEDRR